MSFWDTLSSPYNHKISNNDLSIFSDKINKNNEFILEVSDDNQKLLLNKLL